MKHDLPIVGIRSLAGGLEALQQLFRAMPPDRGLAFVIAAHLTRPGRSMAPLELVEASVEQLNELNVRGRMAPTEKAYLRKDGSRSLLWFTGTRLGDDTVVEYGILGGQERGSAFAQRR